MPMLRRPGLSSEFAHAPNEPGYPKEMRHPAFQPGSVGTYIAGSPEARVSGHYVNGKAMRFPPVTVMNSDQEEYYRSCGYVPRR